MGLPGPFLAQASKYSLPNANFAKGNPIYKTPQIGASAQDTLYVVAKM